MGDKIEVLFDKEFQGGYKKRNLASIARVPVASLINITFGKERKGKAKLDKEEDRPSTSKAPGRLSAGKDAPRQSEWNKKPSKKEAPYTEHPILKKLLAEPGSMKILSRKEEQATSSAPAEIQRQVTVEEKNKAVESKLHDMLGLNLDKKAIKEEKKNAEREEIEAAVKEIMKDVGNQPEEKKKEPVPGKWGAKKDNKSHPKEMVYTNSSMKPTEDRRQETIASVSTPNVMPVRTILPTRASVSTTGPSKTTMIPTSNMDRMHLTDLKPSTILKRGGPVNSRGGRTVPPPQKTPQPVPMPINPAKLLQHELLVDWKWSKAEEVSPGRHLPDILVAARLVLSPFPQARVPMYSRVWFFIPSELLYTRTLYLTLRLQIDAGIRISSRGNDSQIF